MGSFRKRGASWQALVKIDGRQKSKTFDTKAKAQAWAAMMERIPNGGQTLRDAFERYQRDVSTTKRGYRWERIRINQILREWPAVDQTLVSITAADIARWRDNRLEQVGPSSVRREMTLISHVFNVALREWEWIEANPVSRVTRPKSAQARTRVFTDDEVDIVCAALGWAESQPQSASQMTAWVFLFALETAMRSSEILNQTWANVSEKSVHLPMTKNGTSRDVPLTKRARELLQMAQGLDAVRVLPLGDATRDALFRRALKGAGVDGAHFHDSRRTATIRLAKVLQPMELAKCTGHRDLSMLLNTYYGVKADELADKLG